MSKRRKNAGAGYGYMFSGAFAKKADAVKKEKKRKGSFVKAIFLPTGMRYAVMTPRTNPVKRKKKAAPVTAYTPRPTVHPAQNPAELLVMGANPGTKDITLPAGSTITIRINPERSNSLATFLGFAPTKPTKKVLAASRRAFKAGVRAKTAEEREAMKGMRRGARSSQKQSGTARVFHELYGQQTYDGQGLPTNPSEVCGAMIGGFPCSRKPGHRGPHLPQGATMRTRKRLPHKWQPNPSAEALREKFTGKAADRVRIFDEPHMPAGDYAALGKLLSLYVKPRKGGQVQMITASGVTVVADETARQIYFVGGDQDVSAGLHVFGAVDRGAGLFELGDARRIDYKQRKEHVPQPEYDEWKHHFGEESGVMPIVLFDANAKRLMLEGGEYEIRTEGIVN